MGLSVRSVIEMARSQHLHPGNLNQEEVAYQSGALTNSATTMTLASTVNIPDGEIVEWDDNTFEVALVKDQTVTTVNFAARGYLETIGEAHSTGTRIIVGPVYTKKVLYDALQAVIASLRGYGLYARAYTSSLTISTTSPVQLPAGAFGVASILYQNGSQWFPIDPNGYRLLHNYSGVDSAPAIQFFTGFNGAATRIVYKRDYILPDAITLDPGETRFDVDLETECLLPAALAHVLPLGIAAHVLTGRDIPSVDAEHIRRASANAQIPPGTRTSLSRNLQSRFLEAALAERYRLIEGNPVSITFAPFGG